jgi:hypothetical protein
MATVTPNFNWPVPTSTDLVRDGATAIEALGDSIDGSLVDLKGGTTGQVLSKTSGTDMDFTWVTTDDANAIQNSIVDAKGDLIAASANDTPARLAVGANGETLVADSSTSTGLRYTAGNPIPNPILNSCFDVAQRGTSIALNNQAQYTLDRWFTFSVPASTTSRQATNDTTNLPFIQYCARVQRTAGNTSTGSLLIRQPLESANAIPFAGKTITFSFYARAGANYSPTSSLLAVELVTGTGTDQNPNISYTGAVSAINTSATLTTTWQRFSYSATLATNATEFYPQFTMTGVGTAGAADYFEVTGVQIDIGSVALPVRRNGATIQGELAACQRYYQRFSASDNYTIFSSSGTATGATVGIGVFTLKQTMRVAPTSVEGANIAWWDTVNALNTVTLFSLYNSGRDVAGISTTSSGLTAFRPYLLIADNNSSAYIAFSSEL